MCVKCSMFFKVVPSQVHILFLIFSLQYIQHVSSYNYFIIRGVMEIVNRPGYLASGSQEYIQSL